MESGFFVDPENGGPSKKKVVKRLKRPAAAPCLRRPAAAAEVKWSETHEGPRWTLEEVR